MWPKLPQAGGKRSMFPQKEDFVRECATENRRNMVWFGRTSEGCLAWQWYAEWSALYKHMDRNEFAIYTSFTTHPNASYFKWSPHPNALYKYWIAFPLFIAFSMYIALGWCLNANTIETERMEEVCWQERHAQNEETIVIWEHEVEAIGKALVHVQSVHVFLIAIKPSASKKCWHQDKTHEKIEQTGYYGRHYRSMCNFIL